MYMNVHSLPACDTSMKSRTTKILNYVGFIINYLGKMRVGGRERD